MKFLFVAVALLSSSAFAGDKIDLQWSVCDASPEAVLAKLGQSGADETDGSVTYFDNAVPTFLADGVTFRTKGKEESQESSVKIRFDAARDVPEAACEWDRYGNEDRYTCEVTGTPAGSQLWSTAQLDFLSARYRDSNLGGLKSFGPYVNRKWKFKQKGVKVAFDTVDTREAGHIMEVSVKVDYADRDQYYESVSRWLDGSGVALCSRQESKTARLFRAMGLLR